MPDQKEMVKVTIRLPKALAKLAKHHAVARDVDLQDLIAAALAGYLHSLPPAFDAKQSRALLAAMFGQDSVAEPKRNDRKLAASYGGRIKTKGPK
jgi:hypothetical protein